jgi:hypothetical protein
MDPFPQKKENLHYFEKNSGMARGPKAKIYLQVILMYIYFRNGTLFILGARSSLVVKALGCKTEDREFETQ